MNAEQVRAIIITNGIAFEEVRDFLDCFDPETARDTEISGERFREIETVIDRNNIALQDLCDFIEAVDEHEACDDDDIGFEGLWN